MVQKSMFYQDMVKYLLSGTLPQNLVGNQREKFIAKSANYKVVDGVLYDISAGGEGRHVIVDEKEKFNVIQECHIDKSTGTHNSYSRTLQLVASRYAWEGLPNDLSNFIQNCKRCARNTIPVTIDPGQRAAIWQMIEIETFGPFSLENDACIIQVTDLTSKWISCVPVANLSAKEISKALLNHLCKIGMPTAIRFTNQDDHLAVMLTDEFESELRDFVKTVEGIAQFLKPSNEDAPHVAPQVVITKILEDDLFSFKDVEALKIFVDKGKENLSDTIRLYLIVGEESLLEDDLQVWHNSMLKKFINRHPSDWTERIEYFSYALRSYLPNSQFAKAPNYLMFVRNMDIYKDTSKKSNHFSVDEDFFFALEKTCKAEPMQVSDDETSMGEDDDLCIDPNMDALPLKDIESETKTRPHVVCLKNYTEDLKDFVPFLKKKSHISNRMPCSICPDVFFISHDLMEEHLKFHVDGVEGFKCPYCDKVTQMWGSMYIHYCSHDESLPIIGTEEEPTENYLCCPYCAKEFRARSRMLRHLKRLHLGQKNYDCDLCGKEFEERRDLMKHMEVHQNEPGNGGHLYKCRDCNFRTQILSNFKEHASSVHENTSESDHCCQICHKSYPLRSALISHMFTLHGIVSDDIQLKKEAQKTSYGSTVHRCTHCTFKTTSRNSLKLHIKRIHNKTFECDYCSKTMIGEATYQRHLERFHGEEHLLPCPHCGFKSSTAKVLSEHVKYQHDPDMPKLTCPYCSLSFRTLPLLKDHIPTHTGAEIYTCNVCLYKYKYRSNAYRHAKQKHPEVALKDAIERAEIDRNGQPLPKEQSGNEVGFGAGDSQMYLGADVIIPTETTGDLIVPEVAQDVTADIKPSILGEGSKGPICTVDPETGTVIFDGQAFTVDGGTLQVIENGTDGGMQLLLVTALGENNGTATIASADSA